MIQEETCRSNRTRAFNLEQTPWRIVASKGASREVIGVISFTARQQFPRFQASYRPPGPSDPAWGIQTRCSNCSSDSNDLRLQTMEPQYDRNYLIGATSVLPNTIWDFRKTFETRY